MQFPHLSEGGVGDDTRCGSLRIPGILLFFVDRSSSPAPAKYSHSMASWASGVLAFSRIRYYALFLKSGPQVLTVMNPQAAVGLASMARLTLARVATVLPVIVHPRVEGSCRSQCQ